MELGNAIGAALTRIVADGFLLRFQTEAALWNDNKTHMEIVALLERSKALLDQLIQAVVQRVQTLGATSPHSLRQLLALSSLTDNGITASWDVSSIVLERGYLTLIESCRMVTMLARESHDAATEFLMAARIAQLEEFTWRLRDLAQQA